MGETKWTKEQEEVIWLRDRNILVSAAAGSGKTAVLVERMIQMVMDEEHPVDIDRLLVVTFTKAAAGEMRARVGAAMEKKLMEEPGSSRLQRQLSLLHNAQITTIDSFCQSIIRNYFHVIDLDPVFRVADETEMEILKREVLEEVLEESYQAAYEAAEQGADQTAADDFLQLVEMFSSGRDDSAIEGLIRSLAQMALSAPWPMDWLDMVQEQYHCGSVSELQERQWFLEMEQHIGEMLQGYLKKAEETKQLCEDEGAEGYVPAIQSDIDQIRACTEGQGYLEYAKRIAAVQKSRLGNKKSDTADKETKKFIQDQRKMYMDKGILALRDEYFSQSPERMAEQTGHMYPAIRGLVAVTKRFMHAFGERKREEGVLDFSDMEHFALEILVDHAHGDVPSEVAQELQEYYQEIMIDEYQDSSYIQEALLSSLSRSKQGQRPYLFMVGDVKQSIYRFRQARPELFNAKYEQYTEGKGPDQKINLHRNFRSRRMVLESANYLFRQLMQRCLGGIVYDEAAELVPGADFGECDRNIAGKTQVLLIREKPKEDSEDSPDKQKKISDRKAAAGVLAENPGSEDLAAAPGIGAEKNLAAMDKVTLEASVIGEKIRQLVTGAASGKRSPAKTEPEDKAFTQQSPLEGEPLYVRDASGTYRKVQYKDIVILLRSPNSVSDRYIETLAEMGIPAYSETKVGYFGSMEVETVLDYLRIIDNPRQDIPLAAVLKSEFAGLTDDELAAVGALPRHLNFLDGIYAGMEQFEAGLQEKLRHFLAELKKYRDISQIISVYDLLNLIYQETGYYHIMSAMPAGEKRSANLDLLLQRALEYAAKGNHGIFSFVRYIENLRKAEIDYGEAALANENMDAVRIMSIHKSKGLEFPVVFLAGMSKNINQMDARGVVRDSDHGIGVDYVDLEKRYKEAMPMKRFLAGRSKRATLAEEIRILYVALTRAKELLILSGTVKDLEKKQTEWEKTSTHYGLADLIAAKNYMDWMMPLIADAGGQPYFEVEEWDVKKLAGRAEQVIAEELTQQISREMPSGDVCFDEDIRRELDAQEAFQYPYGQSRGIPVKISVTELKRLEQKRALAAGLAAEEAESGGKLLYDTLKDIPRPIFLSGEQMIGGAERGTLYHLALEHLPFGQLSAASRTGDICLWLDELVRSGYLRPEERQELQESRFVRFLKSAVGKRMAAAHAAGTLHREQQFMLGLQAEEIYPESRSTEPVLVQGIIDAWFEEGDGIILVDYKTDYVEKGHVQELLDKYRVQLDCYARALNRLTGKKVLEEIIYSVPLGEMASNITTNEV